MAKVYDPIMCMMVEQRTNDASRAYSVGYKSNGVFQSIGVMANSEQEAVEKAKRYFASKGRSVEVYGASIGESLETMKMKGKPVLDARACDADPVFKNIYDSFTRSLNAAGKMDPDAAQTYIQKIIIGHINSMNDRFNTISSEHTDLCNKIRKEGQEELRKVIDKYRRENR